MNFQQVQRFLGTTTNDDAAAGYVGEYQTAQRLAASALSLTTATYADITSISLTAGDWDVTGTVSFVTAGTTSFTFLAAGISTTSATAPGADSGGNYQQAHAATVPGASTNHRVLPTVRMSLASTTTVYLVAGCVFTVSTMTAYGILRARRVR